MRPGTSSTGMRGLDSRSTCRRPAGRALPLGVVAGLETEPQPGALTDAVLSSGALNLSIGALSTPTSQQTAINPVDQALAYTGTWLDV